ncbi:MAG: type I-B CRISPR-associated protein Cas8b1/Cst1 [Clostridia bacterium]|nr:type I-B CRISPR-associated protein Cas8b1/Cst1 [Clostridia bacterium]
MKIKIYLQDWFYNAGLIGFHRIFKDKSKLVINDNYIELESDSLSNFADDYFEYFFKQYNVAEKTLQRIENNLKIIKQNLEKEPITKEERNKINEIIKTQKKYFKDTIKIQLNKIKKFDEETYENILQVMNSIDEIKEKEDIYKLEEIQDIIKINLEKQSINQKLTMNLFKSILSNSYYGQPSFLNVVKSALSYEEQKQIMYKDYISNIVETGFLKEIIDNKYTVEQIENILKEKDQNLLTKEIIKIYNNVQKQIEKNKSIEEIKEYIENKAFSNCSMCENNKVITNQYSESNFIPLAVSSDNMPNFFWNQNAKLPICDMCKLILFCIPAGITSIIKTVKENGAYKEKTIYSFVNYDTNVQNLLETNNYFKEISKKDMANYNPYSEMIVNIVGQSQKISNWQLQNIFVVEFEAEYLSYSRMEYFNITRPVAIFFTKYAEQSLNKIYDYKYRIQIVDHILKNKDISIDINNKIRDNFKQKIQNNVDSYYATKVRMNLNMLRKGENDMEETIKENNKKLGALYKMGISTREEFINKKIENKLDGYIYRMLNCIKQGDRNEFMDIVIRLHISIEKSVSPIFIESMKEEGLAFEDIGHSYLSGLASERYKKEEEENKHE